ncbi:MAG: GGDEF domain-containing protein, partial [Bacilli bacterium]
SDMTNFMVEKIIETTGGDAVAFVMLTDIALKSYRVLPNSSEFFSLEESVLYLDNILEKIFLEFDPIYVGDFRQLVDEHPKGTHIEYRSVMAVPMIAQSHISGFVVVLGKRDYAFSFEQFKLLQSLVQHSTLALANSILREELEIMVITDYLTKLHSRKYLDEKVRCSMEVEQEGVFLLLDVDNFKTINDIHGHQVGDEILVQISQIIKANIRGADIAARWGGEELAVYLPNVNEDIGSTIAERIRSKIENGTKPSVTVSVGLAHWNVDDIETPRSLFSRADEALYLAKRNGKNCVKIL